MLKNAGFATFGGFGKGNTTFVSGSTQDELFFQNITNSNDVLPGDSSRPAKNTKKKRKKNVGKNEMHDTVIQPVEIQLTGTRMVDNCSKNLKRNDLVKNAVKEVCFAYNDFDGMRNERASTDMTVTLANYILNTRKPYLQNNFPEGMENLGDFDKSKWAWAYITIFGFCGVDMSESTYTTPKEGGGRGNYTETVIVPEMYLWVKNGDKDPVKCRLQRTIYRQNKHILESIPRQCCKKFLENYAPDGLMRKLTMDEFTTVGCTVHIERVDEQGNPYLVTLPFADPKYLPHLREDGINLDTLGPPGKPIKNVAPPMTVTSSTETKAKSSATKKRKRTKHKKPYSSDAKGKVPTTSGYSTEMLLAFQKNQRAFAATFSLCSNVMSAQDIQKLPPTRSITPSDIPADMLISAQFGSLKFKLEQTEISANVTKRAYFNMSRPCMVMNCMNSAGARYDCIRKGTRFAQITAVPNLYRGNTTRISYYQHFVSAQQKKK